jgi:cephalosporin-C deacetylase-like acetyl esterase
MKTISKCIPVALSALLFYVCALAQEHPICKADSLPASTPWNLAQLSNTPAFEWAGGDEMRGLFYAGEPYQGNATRVFAWYATPGTLAGDPAKDKNLPGIVLVHGGGGTAFAEWVKLWASRGYAAIAMDLAGVGPDGERHAHAGPDQQVETKFITGAEATDQWSYHTVAAVIRAHSLLLSFPEVDARRTAITGISWGGYLTCIVAGLDDRFQAAVPVYGCGFIHENSNWLNRFEQMTDDDRATWVRLWDPSMYVGSVTMPMLFVNGGRDFAYPPDSHAKTYALVRSPKNLHFVPDLKHGHIFDRPAAIEVFIRQTLEGGTPLARIAEPHTNSDTVTALVEAQTELVKAELHYTLDPVATKPETRQWHSRPASIHNGRIEAPRPPVETRIWFLTAEDERQTTVSSALVFPGEDGP